MSVTKRLVDCKRGAYRSGRAKQRLMYFGKCGKCGREFPLNAYQRGLYVSGVKKSFTCGCGK